MEIAHSPALGPVGFLDVLIDCCIRERTEKYYTILTGDRIKAAGLPPRGTIVPRVVSGLLSYAHDGTCTYVCLGGVSVAGASLLFRDGDPLFPSKMYHDYFENSIKGDQGKLDQLRRLPQKKIESGLIHLLNARYAPYGHFISECFSRVFLVKILYDSGYRLPIAMPDDAPPYVKEITRLIIPGAEFIDYTVREEVLTPDFCIGMATLSRPVINSSD